MNIVKILWVDHIYLDTASHSTFPLFLIDSLLKKGHEVQLLVPSIKKGNQDTTLLANNIVYIPTVRLPFISSLIFSFMLLFYLPKTVKKMSPHAIVVDKYIFPGMIWSYLFRKIKLIVDIRSTFVWEKGIRAYIDKMQYAFSVILAKYLSDCITVTSFALKQESCKVFGINPLIVKVLTNGVSSHLLAYKKNRMFIEKLRKELQLHEKFVIFYHGSLGHKRGLLETIKAIKKLASKYPEIAFFVLGSGHRRNSLISLIKKNSLENNVYIHEAVSHVEIPKFISMSDVGIAPLDTFSYPRTSCPLKVLEYLAMEKIVIATDIPFNRELLRYGNCMIHIPSNSSRKIAEAIEYVYKNKNELKKMGKMGKTIIEQHYTWDSKAAELVEIIEAIEK